jgi:osmoprotectant transport system permease protein
VKDQLALLPGYLTAHLQLTLVALLLGVAVSVPAGIWVTRRRSLEPGVLGVASVIQTIPSLALLAIMVPALGALGAFTASLGFQLSSIGYLPAIVALTLYSILPILRNTVTGIESVDPALVEAARGVGMTDRQRLRQVELPLALPVIVAGVRTAAVWVVGTATLSTPVGATSLGNYIFSGLQTRNTAAVLVGCVAAALLALALDQTIRLLEIGAGRRDRRRLAVALAVLVGLYGYTAVSFAASRSAAGAGPLVRIGAKAFTEQYILSEMLAQQVRRETGLSTEIVPSLGSTVAFDALRAGDLDLYVDYSGTIFATIMQRTDTFVGREKVLADVERFLSEQHGIRSAGSLGFQNTYALGMSSEVAQRFSVRGIGDLARVASRLEIGGDYEFFQRTEWAALVDAYGLAFARQRSMDPALMYEAVRSGDVDVISAFSTDGRIAAYDIVLLEDEKGVIPPYDALVLVGPALVERAPEVLEAVSRLAGTLDEQTMQRLNLAVDRDKRAPAQVAREFLAEEGAAAQ